MLRRTSLGICLGAAAAWAQRLRPPEGLGCSRDELTSYSGVVTRYSRTLERVKLLISTDSNTRESVEVKLDAGAKAQDYFLINGEPFEMEDFAKIEIEPSRLKDGMRAIAWVCQGDRPAMIDWRPPPDNGYGLR